MSQSKIFLLLAFVQLLFAENNLAFSWDTPKKVDENTVFFGEKERLVFKQAASSENEAAEFARDGKSYAWRHLERGNNFLLAGHLEKAAADFARAYKVPGPTRVLSGFKLIEADEKLGRLDEAIRVLEEMKQKYLVSTKEFEQASHIRSELEDKKRKSVPAEKPAKLVGRDWLYNLSSKRMDYVLEGMELLRAQGVPLKEPAQEYIFFLDEYFIAHPEASADNPAEVLADLIYERDAEARVPIDRWRLSKKEPNRQARNIKASALKTNEKLSLTGAEWIRMTHNDKISYILGAMEVLETQNVPMQRTAHAYEYAVDELFTNKPELSASDSVLTLASILYDTEPEAREVLEAIRLE